MSFERQGVAYDPEPAGHGRLGRDGPSLPYIFRWSNHGRKGQACRVTARSDRPARGGERVDLGSVILGSVTIVFGWPPPKNFNSIRVEFSDGYVMVTSGNAIRKARR